MQSSTKKDNTFQEFPFTKKCEDCFLEHYPTVNSKLASNFMVELDNHISYREEKKKVNSEENYYIDLQTVQKI